MDISSDYFIKAGYQNADYSAKHLTDVGAKKVKFEESIFNYALIERGYFHEATFVKCKFIGTRFLGCNFRSARFIECDFQYATFNGCILPLDSIVENLPYPPNQRRDVLRSLRVNSVSIGDYTASPNTITLFS